jgi:hypothetical protein
MTDLTTHVPPAALRERTVEVPRFEPLPSARLSAIISAGLNRPIVLPAIPDAELTARHPYDPHALMDFFMPGRWDSTSGLVFMDSIVNGPEPGMWDGTAGYIQFTAPADGSYLVVVNFSGYQQTMRIDGPWGTSTAHTATTSDHGAVSAQWSGTSGTTLYFTMSCASDNGLSGIGYLRSIQFFRQ